MSNTGQTNLDWEDANNYGGGMEGLETGISDDGGMYMMHGTGMTMIITGVDARVFPATGTVVCITAINLITTNKV